MSNYACFIDEQGRVRQVGIPDGDYGVGHLVTTSDRKKKFKITGQPHHEPTKGTPTVCDLLWPAQPIDSIDPLLTREKD